MAANSEKVPETQAENCNASKATEDLNLTLSNADFIVMDEWQDATPDVNGPQSSFIAPTDRDNTQPDNTYLRLLTKVNSGTEKPQTTVSPTNTVSHITIYNWPLKRSNNTWKTNTDVTRDILDILGKDWGPLMYMRCSCIYPRKPKMWRGRVHLSLKENGHAYHFWSLLYKFEDIPISFKWGTHIIHRKPNFKLTAKQNLQRPFKTNRQQYDENHRGTFDGRVMVDESGLNVNSKRIPTPYGKSERTAEPSFNYEYSRHRRNAPTHAGATPPEPNLNYRGKDACPPFVSAPNNILINQPRGFTNIRNSQRIRKREAPRIGVNKSPSSHRMYQASKGKSHLPSHLRTSSRSDWHLDNRYAPLAALSQD